MAIIPDSGFVWKRGDHVTKSARDEYLEFLLDPYIDDQTLDESGDGRFFSHITLVLNGAVVSGRPISTQRYLALKRELLVEGIQDALPPDEVRDAAIEMHNDAYDRLGQQVSMRAEKRERLWEELAEGETPTEDQVQALEEYRPKFLHLEDVTLFLGSIRVSDAGLWRVRLSDVSGWTLGAVTESA